MHCSGNSGKGEKPPLSAKWDVSRSREVDLEPLLSVKYNAKTETKVNK